MRGTSGRSHLRHLVALLALSAGVSLAAEPPASATGRSAEFEGKHRVEGALLIDVDQVKAGDTFRVGVRFKMEPGWHLYWKNPGDSGLSTEISWDTPGVEVGELQWPFPSTFRSRDGFIVTYGYGNEVLFFAEARAPPDPSGPLTIAAAADFLVCEVNCIPAEMVLTRTLPTGAETRPAADARPAFDAFAARVPEPASEAGIQAQVQLNHPLKPGAKFEGKVTLTRADGAPVDLPVEPDFFAPDRIDGVATMALAAPTSPGVFPMKGEASADAPKGTPEFRGVIRLGTQSTGFEALELTAPFTEVKGAGAIASGEPSVPLSLALLFAFLGGVILNLMPCVFPVLALKVYGFTRIVQEEGGRKGLHALGYAGGILVSMAALAGVVVAVRAAGHGVGWGFQFQEPLFVALVCAVLVAFALNLFGVFYVGQPGSGLVTKVDHSHGVWRSAGEGVLAVVLATPCSAPLLGTAVGFAIAAGTFATFSVFLAIGLGLAAPFCVLVFVPGLAKRLPKPGAWMERVKQLLGFALLATAVWLIWVLGGLTGIDGMARLLAFLVAVGVGAWAFGLAQSSGGGRRAAGFLLALVVIVAAGLSLLRFEVASSRSLTADHSTREWNDAEVQSALAAGQPVFIDFTADWCLTCKFNERTVISSDAVQQAFATHRVAFFVADWTRRDERIRKKLEEFGRAGVPMYLLVSPHRPTQPEVLPELLTADQVLEALARATTKS